jgi:hypothetical protein
MSDRKAAATSKGQGGWVRPLVALLFLAACDRTSLLPVCSIDVTPAVLDLGQVAPGDQVSLSVDVANRGSGACHISGVGLDPGSDPGFALASLALLTVNPGQQARIFATFRPASVSVPLVRLATLTVQSNDPIRPTVQVALKGQIQTNCTMSVRPSAGDFGRVPIDTAPTVAFTVVNNGTAACDIAGIAIGQGSDPQFSLDPGQNDHFSLAPEAEQPIVTSFHASDVAAPDHRTGTLVFESTDARQMTVTIPLSADIDIGCTLTIAPDSLDFGSVILNATASRAITLVNQGSKTCQISGIDLGPGSDPGFVMDPGQAHAFAVTPQSSQTIAVNFGAFDATPPHSRAGTLALQTGSRRVPTESVPLSATVDTACVDASRWIYTVDGTTSMLSRFDPTTLSFFDIGVLECTDEGKPFSMAVDQHAVAWVVYDDANLFQVDTGTGRCQATSFRVDSSGPYIWGFGMGFVFQPSTGVDTLYISSVGNPSKLATVSLSSMVLTPIGPLTVGDVELTGTGDGQLWGFVPPAFGPDVPAFLVRLDPTIGQTLESYSYLGLHNGAWAVKFWGGSFWIFLNRSVYAVPRNNPSTIRTVIADIGDRNIVGAGVSTCAPLF